MKESGLRVRVDDLLRQEFIDICRAQDKTAAQVIRTFMRDYVKEHSDAKQRDLFTESKIANGYL